MLPGEEKCYFSVDAVVSHEDEEAVNFRIELLKQQRLSGMPPYCQGLKLVPLTCYLETSIRIMPLKWNAFGY